MLTLHYNHNLLLEFIIPSTEVERYAYWIFKSFLGAFYFLSRGIYATHPNPCLKCIFMDFVPLTQSNNTVAD